MNHFFYNNFNRKHFLNSFKKELTMYLPAQEIKSVTNLNQQLVQAGLNVNDFTVKFNKLTQDVPIGVIVPVSVFYTPKEKTFEITIRPLQLKQILSQFVVLKKYLNLAKVVKQKYQINFLNLYKTLIIKGSLMHMNEKHLKIFFRSLLGTLRSYQYPIEIIFTLDDIKKMLDERIIDETKMDLVAHYFDIDSEIQNQKVAANVDGENPHLEEFIDNEEASEEEEIEEHGDGEESEDYTDEDTGEEYAAEKAQDAKNSDEIFINTRDFLSKYYAGKKDEPIKKPRE